jgi:hypothetical protein
MKVIRLLMSDVPIVPLLPSPHLMEKIAYTPKINVLLICIRKNLDKKLSGF